MSASQHLWFATEHRAKTDLSHRLANARAVRKVDCVPVVINFGRTTDLADTYLTRSKFKIPEEDVRGGDTVLARVTQMLARGKYATVPPSASQSILPIIVTYASEDDVAPTEVSGVGGATIAQVYADFKSNDDHLYIVLMGQNVFGGDTLSPAEDRTEHVGHAPIWVQARKHLC